MSEIDQAVKSISVESGKVRHRLEFIDAIRGIAALLVVLHHFLLSYAHQFIVVDKMYLFNPGHIGVTAFFMVSGYIIPFSVSRGKSVREFLVNRFFRLYPIYWLSLIGIYWGWRQGYGFIEVADFHSIWQWVVNLTMFQTYLGVQNINVVGWTLALEWIIYAIVVVWIIRGSSVNYSRFVKLSIGFLGFTTVLLPLLIHHRIPMAYITCFFPALSGLVWFKRDDGTFTSSLARTFGITVIGVNISAVLMNYLVFRSPDAGANNWIWLSLNTFAGYGGFYLVYGLRNRKFPAIFGWFGSISYALYLNHMLIREVVSSVSSNPWVSASIALVASILFSFLAHKFVEDPMIKLGKKLAK